MFDLNSTHTETLVYIVATKPYAKHVSASKFFLLKKDAVHWLENIIREEFRKDFKIYQAVLRIQKR